jgi:hypothetical protein
VKDDVWTQFVEKSGHAWSIADVHAFDPGALHAPILTDFVAIHTTDNPTEFGETANQDRAYETCRAGDET